MKNSFAYIDPSSKRRMIVLHYATTNGTKEFSLGINGEAINFSIEPEDFDNVEITWTMENAEKLSPIEFYNLIDALKEAGHLYKGIGKRDQFLRSLNGMSRQERRKALRNYEKKTKGKFTFTPIN
jgi:hypothetical protein